MSNIELNIKGEIICILFILFSFILAFPFYKINPEYSRKVIHIMLGNFYFIALFYFSDWYFACLGPFAFIFVNYFSIKYRFIKLMLRHPKKNDKNIKYDYGTVYYAISLTIITIYSWKIKKPEITAAANAKHTDSSLGKPVFFVIIRISCRDKTNASIGIK